MIRNVRTTRVLLLCLAAALVLAGCPGSGPGGGRVTLRYVTFEAQAEQVKILREIIRRFEEKHPRVHVQLEANLNAAGKIQVEVASGVPPDVFYLDTNSLVKMAKNNVILDLRPYAEKDGVDLSQYFPASIDALSWKGGLYAMPSDLSTRALFYNTALFDRYGVKRPGSEWTMEDFLAAAKRLTVDTNGDGKTDIFGTVTIVQDFLLWAQLGGAEVFNGDFTECAIVSPEALAALTFVLDLKDRHHVVPSSADMANAGPLSLFTAERVAMFIGRTYMAAELDKTMSGRYDVAPLPRGKAMMNLLTVGGNAVASRGSHVVEAWAFVKFYSSEEVQALRGKAKNCVPALISVAESKDGFKAPPPEHAALLVEQAYVARPETPGIERANEFKQEIWVPAFEDVTLRRIGLKDALREIRTKTKTLLEKER